jgi:hypothetical protein
MRHTCRVSSQVCFFFLILFYFTNVFIAYSRHTTMLAHNNSVGWRTTTGDKWGLVLSSRFLFSSLCYFYFINGHLRDYDCEWRMTGEAKKGDGYGARDSGRDVSPAPGYRYVFFFSICYFYYTNG